MSFNLKSACLSMGDSFILNSYRLGKQSEKPTMAMNEHSLKVGLELFSGSQSS